MDARGGGGRDWVRHELCGQLVSNLFSSKTLRERLSKKPVAGILVGLLCGQPCRGNRTPHAGQSVSVYRALRVAEGHKFPHKIVMICLAGGDYEDFRIHAIIADAPLRLCGGKINTARRKTRALCTLIHETHVELRA